MSEPPAVPELHTARLLLRRLAESDAPGLHAAYGDPVAMRFWDAPPCRDVEETAARIRQSLQINPQWHAAFAAVLRDGGQFVGMVNYHQRVPAHRRLAVGWILAAAWWRQGLAQEATRALLDHCFTALDAHRIEAQIEPENAASLRLAERRGFCREGLMRDCLFVDGKPRTAFLYALLRPDWDHRIV
ncbi:MAG: GNAT family N-acetyltransferase [Alphaproteobacteria bacterium]|nr:GNAT family N-acetyltransferase [Alphaproteobacteria bacterium]